MSKNKSYFKNKSILITGGTGSFGQEFVEKILHNFSEIKVLSNRWRNEEIKRNLPGNLLMRY